MAPNQSGSGCEGSQPINSLRVLVSRPYTIAIENVYSYVLYYTYLLAFNIELKLKVSRWMAPHNNPLNRHVICHLWMLIAFSKTKRYIVYYRFMSTN